MRKAQWRILPIIFLAYLVAYIDRTNISFAAASMNADLGFTATIYGIAGGIFFLSYATLEVPSNMAMMRFGPRVWLTRIMVTWGIVSAATMFVQTPLQFYIMRFLLGAAEAGFFPAVLYYVSHWFPGQWRGRAVSRFYIAVSLASVVMGIVSAPILGLDGTFGLRGWQCLLLIEGIPAIVMGGVVFTLLPDTPAAAKWLAPDERRWIQSALAADADRMAATEHGSVLRAICDPLVLMFGIGFLCIVGVNNAFILSTPQILAAKTGFDIAAVGWLVALGGALGAAALLANAWHSDRAGERFWHIVIPAIIMGTAYVVLAFSTSPTVIVVGFLASVMSCVALQPVFWAALSETLHRRHLAVGAAAVNTIAQFGAFLSPIAFGVARDATGSYDLGIAVLPLSFFAAAAIFNHIRLRVGRPVAVLPA